MKDLTDRTLTFRLRTNDWGARMLFRALSQWMDGSPDFRRVDMFKQRVDGVPMEKDNDNTKKLSKETRSPYDGSTW